MCGGESGSKRSVCRNRAAGRFSAPRGETLLLLPPRPSQTCTRARGHEGPRGIGSGCEVNSARGDDTTQLYCIQQEYRGAQGVCPWSPSQEGARDQSSSARRGLPSKGESRALHHQPAPALTLTMPCFCSTRHSTGVCVLLLQDLLQSCARGGRRRVEDMCYERRRAEACVDGSAHHALVNAGGREIV